jgi:hypothetical protein
VISVKRLDTHEGTRRIWSGKVDTLCGLVLPAETRWTPFGKATCRTCRQLKSGK